MPRMRQNTPQIRRVADADLISACSKRAQCEGSKDPNQKPAWIISTCQKKATNAKPESIIMIMYSSSQNGESAQLKLSHIRPKSAGLHAQHDQQANSIKKRTRHGGAATCVPREVPPEFADTAACRLSGRTPPRSAW